MAFINAKKIKNMAQAASTAAHPLLSETTLDAAVRTAYVQGCALATLIDDEKVSPAERDLVRRIGLSLRMPDDEIGDCFEVVGSLSDDDEKEQFVTETLALLKAEPVGRYFIADFEKVLALGGEVSGESLEVLDSFGAMLFEDADWRRKKEAVEAEKRKAAEAKLAADRAEKKKMADAEKARAMQERLEAKNKAFYEKMRKYVADYVDKKRISRDLFLEIGDELSDSEFKDVDFQMVFREIAAQMLNRVEELNLPEIEKLNFDSFFGRSVRKKGGGELTQKERERFEQARVIARETLWMVICLAAFKVAAEDIPIGKTNEILGSSFSRDSFCRNCDWCDFWCGGAGLMTRDGVEELFADLLGVRPVWRSLFSLTEGQRKKLDSWMARRKEFSLDDFEEYAHSIGVSRYCDARTIHRLLRVAAGNGQASESAEEPEDVAMSARKFMRRRAVKAAPLAPKRK